MFTFEKAKKQVDFTTIKEGQKLQAKMSGFKFRKGHCIAYFEDDDSEFDAYLGTISHAEAMTMKDRTVFVKFNGMTDNNEFPRLEVIDKL